MTSERRVYRVRVACDRLTMISPTVTPLPSTLTLPDCSGFSTQWHFSRRQGSLVFMNGMDDLRPKIPTNVVSLIDALVEPLYRNMDRLGTVLLYQVTRCLVDVGGHR